MLFPNVSLLTIGKFEYTIIKLFPFCPKKCTGCPKKKRYSFCQSGPNRDVIWGPWVIYALRPPTCALSKSAENVLSDLWGADPTISDQAEYLLSDPYYWSWSWSWSSGLHKLASSNPRPGGAAPVHRHRRRPPCWPRSPGPAWPWCPRAGWGRG